MIRKHSAGQALVESALALPFVLLLLTGGVQVGSIAYGAVSVDTAAREGARVGSESPYTSLTAVAAAPGGTYTCQSPSTETNPICTAVYNSGGLLNTSNMTVTIKAPVSLSLLPVPDDVVQVTNSGCNNSQATVSGAVTYNGSNVPDSWTVQVSSSTGGTPATVTGGQYSTCFSHTTGQNTATISVQAMTSPDGCLYTASMSGLTLSNNSSLVENFALTQSSCPTSSTSTTSTTTTTTTTTNTSTGTIAQTSTSSVTVTCPSTQTVVYPNYFTVTVTYPVPIFVPFVDRVLGDAGNRGQRTMTTTVTAQVVPCGVSGGQ